jgi:ribonucleoside-diphosphate reductase alpha chain
MRVIDPAWIGKKLRGLKDLPEAQGDFFARVPGSETQAVQPSTIAYVARLLIHRYAMLGVLDAGGYPVAGGTVLWSDAPAPGEAGQVVLRGKSCPECGHPALIRRDGCDFCTACGHVGACG